MDMKGLLILWLVVIMQRLWELVRAKRNENWIRKQGGIEIGQGHYPLMMALHVCFFISILIEARYVATEVPSWWMIPLLLFMATQGLRMWSIRSLGQYWNTRIWVLPGKPPQVQGPYRFMRHPNYVVVMLEMILFPVIFGAVYTALIFSILNAVILVFIRIPMEEEALARFCGYEEVMIAKRRFFPIRIKK
ncbi:hypothetical protein IC620_00535 [Hazenella sp. IB182357]|uniref:Isoprenylcysteine carboxyl methyltransferase n=1 Tax=Polycladospora coralii TaxID=2771432 RepID=A0A926RT42_9BACL|nr:isoprenylcysteine carboxylmethyltransferase family protein [Polycladospora coralii]MBD1370847.1 hypothetical protein [Polycladospora coralii]MBS7529786.1 hypothetical protein [Polycladospora coralii]